MWSMVPRVIGLALFVLCTSALAGQSAETNGIVRGEVVSSVDSRPVVDAEILLTIGSGTRISRTDERGQFSINRVPDGHHGLQVRRLGYLPSSLTVDVQDGTASVTVRLAPSTQVLQSVRVRRSFSGVRGVVGADSTLEPIVGARVAIMGTSGRAKTDSVGGFLIGIRPGAYIARISAPGFRPSLRSILVRWDTITEVVELLATGQKGSSIVLEAALTDAYTRLNARGPMSVVVSGEELRQTKSDGLVAALMQIRTTSAKGLRLGRSVCIFLNGRPMPDLGLSMLNTAEVEALEVYTKASDTHGALGQLWPPGRECGSTGVASKPDPSVTIAWIVVWTRQ